VRNVCDVCLNEIEIRSVFCEQLFICHKENYEEHSLQDHGTRYFSYFMTGKNTIFKQYDTRSVLIEEVDARE
jgi:hypothetical protein